MRPEQATLKAGNHESRVSRCAVCARRRPDVRIGSPSRQNPGSNDLSSDYELPEAKEAVWG